ncbi:MAG: metallophosphoesterase [Candidatus Melainabacteria bacterium]|nr:metallophosphoesterase [Candidatus Melainabacteria bacterium]
MGIPVGILKNKVLCDQEKSNKEQNGRENNDRENSATGNSATENRDTENSATTNSATTNSATTNSATEISDRANSYSSKSGHVAVAILALCLVLFSAGNLNKAIAQSAPTDVFLIKPYIQLGDQPKLQKSESMDILWFPNSPTDDVKDWKLEFDCSKQSKWQTGKIVETKRIGSLGGQSFFRYTGRVTGLKPGESFVYRLSKGGKQVFQAGAMARKSEKQPFRFAVVGDVGAGSDGQKEVVFQMLKQKPDFLLIPGDIVYNCGLVSEYLQRFFPIMNCDTNSPKVGAPFMRSILTLASIGNHDIALANAWEGTDFTRFPDALGYYLLFSQPCNGPSKVVNGKNSTRIVGNAQNQLGFIRAAGKTFPAMSNFSYDYGNSHWVVLDGNPYMDWTDKKTRDWVDRDLENAKSATWKFAAFHQPGFSVDAAHATEQRMRLLSDIFEKHNVDIVFSGHAHCYQRSYPLKFTPDWKSIKGTYHDSVAGTFALDKKYDGSVQKTPNGIIYIVTGGGGAGLYARGVNDVKAPFMDKYVYAHSFTLCDANDKSLKVSQVSTDGKLLDQFTLTKALVKSR